MMPANRIQTEDIKRCVGIVVARLKMKLEEPIPSGKTIRVLLVEGKTDEVFVAGKTADDIKCFPMGSILKARNAFRDDDAQNAVNSKEAIMQTVYGLNVLPAIIDCKGADKWKVYGIVDRDYDDFEAYTCSRGLYVTDTHDIETLLISTDPAIWSRLEKCEIKQEDITKALFIAYQLAILRNAIRQIGDVTIRSIKSGSYDVDFSAFVDDGKIALRKLLDYLNERNKEIAPEAVLSSKDSEKLIQNILKDKQYKKLLNSEGEFKTSIENFETDKIDNFWIVVDGHDILALIKYINENAAVKYNDYTAYSLNRDFEMDLIKSYDHAQFKRTALYSNMLRDKVTREY